MARTVALVIFAGAQALDITGPMDVFAEANRFLLLEQQYQLEVIGIDHGLMRCSNGLSIKADRHYSEVTEGFDLLLCVGGPSLPQMDLPAEFYTWLIEISKKCKKYGSICNGAFMLAHAGLLDGRKATTHWNDASALKKLCPTAEIDPDLLYVEDNELVTSAGVTAGIDLSLFLLSNDNGAEVSLNVAKRLVVFKQRSGGQSQFSPFLTLHAEPTSPIAIVQQHVLHNMRARLTVDELAKLVNMSPRHFSRVFMQEVQVTPAEFVERARVDAARMALECNQLPLKTIAYECGFHSSHHMRCVFVKRMGVSPQQFRKNFGSKK
ncbi:GlxA family transcriptional regulator [Pseudomonas sp. JR33AA]|uniref:GlxA family transcriptional regulator n=1 Tax=Pseudomonas sp. JR33AA TaxID=2899113 RepID=UPI001F1C9A41|nr:DJ-1/PfpI family protein [Pseudomonas sp. JR33AA]MCE5977612.1 DJ-1/PfpI family protein [Pseudomonas sp. JR33AA]